VPAGLAFLALGSCELDLQVFKIETLHPCCLG
jgi:hypothetical protein